ncbi:MULTISPECIES: hypothetical protein [Sphingobium]|uniref:Uncharacterized protein n=2 Tax=Sphingobium cupriresistens TaxID=1132417 RepID=A0A0J7Y5K1_9SPHN|nr:MULTISPECIES: hypothetical protein [Sphingobium]KMS58663.1 hypothetical protein V473_01420 [Sphingobium cupriresistens LL01]MBJ7378060.1 hypothetical protein [Sphingobium sp.]RYM14183.1 hypothetical protein EWH12_03170 [Sphingobium cupriresistens]WCP13900.1 hypothetical protein sphantq_02339 [Sphingobium sp. AntQ-1]
MRNFDDQNLKTPARRRGVGNLAILGMAMILGVAALSAYVISGKDAPVKPASGSAQAMALAGSKPSR